jgi:2-succinyl-6-hydroxy-2,4-cyclohexadiene-1-carboxylate synthase
MIHALHGNAGLPDDLVPLLRAIGADYKAWHLWDWLERHPHAASFGGVASALNTAGPDRPRILLGYSLGGRLALQALTQQPDAWDAAILLSTHPGLTDEEERRTRLTQDQAWAERFLHEPWAEVMKAWNAQPVLAGGKGSAPLLQVSAEKWRREVALSFDVWSLARQPDTRLLLADVTCPVLWITGAADPKFTHLAADAARRMPRAQCLIIPDAGHRVHLDQPPAVASAVREFLRLLPLR